MLLLALMVVVLLMVLLVVVLLVCRGVQQACHVGTAGSLHQE